MSGRERWPKSQEDDKDTIKSRYPEPQTDTAFNANTPERGDSITASHTFPETTRNLSLCLLSLSCEGGMNVPVQGSDWHHKPCRVCSETSVCMSHAFCLASLHSQGCSPGLWLQRRRHPGDRSPTQLSLLLYTTGGVAGLGHSLPRISSSLAYVHYPQGTRSMPGRNGNP